MTVSKKEHEQQVINSTDADAWLSDVDDTSVFSHRMRLCAGLIGNVLKLSERADISYSGTRGYFNGSEPSRDNLSRIARASGVRFEWLGEGTGPMRDLPEILVQGVLHSYRTYCHQHSLPDTRETRIQFVGQYNAGKISTVENLHRLLPKIAFVELRDWLAGVAPHTSTPVRDRGAAKHAPSEFIESLYKDIGDVVEEYFSQRSEKPGVAQILNFTIRAYQIIYAAGVRELSPECRKVLPSLLQLIELGSAKAADSVRAPENV